MWIVAAAAFLLGAALLSLERGDRRRARLVGKSWLWGSALGLAMGCGGDEFSTAPAAGGAGGAPSGGGPSGGAPNGGAPNGGAPNGGAPNGGGPSGGGAGAGGSFTGGTGGAVACGTLNARVLLYTTLDSAAEVASPAVGNGTGELLGNPVAGVCNGAIAIEANYEHVKYPALGNFYVDKGTLDFYFRPNFDTNDDSTHHLVIVPGKFQVVKTRRATSAWECRARLSLRSPRVACRSRAASGFA